jgi:acetylornithine deacetylase/succinyl-diaminopimelate desuccinylase-like protein
MDSRSQELAARIDPVRLRELTLDLVRIPSPTGDCAAAAEFYAGVLQEAGMDARIGSHQPYPSSPSVIARLTGHSPGPALQLDGHLDTIHTPHAPPRFEAGKIHGRGAADMKSGLIAAAEVARVLAESGRDFAGELLITAHGMHEAPWGLGETLRLLIEAGHFGDAAICVEGAHDELAVAGKGLGIFELTVRREGGAVHELAAAPELPHPILVGNQLVDDLQAENARFSSAELPFGLGSESYFIGVFESGDFYNRVPTKCRIVGTRRYGPERAFSDVDAEFRGLIERVAGETGATIDARFWRQRDGFMLDPGTPVAVALRSGYQEVCGRALPLGGMRYVADNSILIREAGIPALQYGVGLGRAHADKEWVNLDDIVTTAQVLLLTALEYWGEAA